MPKSVDRWIEKAKAAGVRSIICLLDDELGFYKELPANLVSYYRAKGFSVEHIPVRLRQPLLSEAQLRNDRLPKPVLIHCSAGIGRSGKAVLHIKRQLKTEVT